MTSKIVNVNKKIEQAAVRGYKKIENTVVDNYKKVEDKFVDTFLKKDDETTREAKERIQRDRQKNLKNYKN